ncbi:MAG: pitrilysin family protein [Verrucomicrobiota bacterium]
MPTESRTLRTVSPTPDSAEPEIPFLPAGTRLTTLENGLTIISREDHSAPVVSAQAWCKAGSIDEGRWLGAGLSHMLEHMLFKGTTTRGAGRIDQEVQDAGGYMNAYTSFDRTVYYINVPNTGADVAIDILCDIMRNATLPAEEVEREKQVILREMDMNQDDPGRRASRRLFETAYTRSPYRYTVIGYPDIFNEVQREDLVSFYREKYAPNNIFFVLVGDLKTEAVENRIRKAFAGVRARPLPPQVLPAEPQQAGPREMIEEAPIEVGHFHIAWHIPDLRHADTPALDVLATLLGSGHSSRLYQEVREKQGVVHSADAWTYSPGNPGLLGMSAVIDPPQFTPARAALLAEVDRMKRDLVAESELSKAVKQFTAATLATRKTMQGQAQDLGGNWLAAADLNFSERYLAAVRRVTPEQLRDVARQYLTPENRTFYALLPTGSSPTELHAAEVLVENPIRKFELANGLRLLVKEDHRLPFVEFRAVFKGGVLAENPRTNGVTLLLAKLLLKGTARRTAEQIVTEIESLGGSIDSYGGNNSFGVNAQVLKVDFDQGLDLLADVILRPTFPPSALERERQIQLANIRAQRDHLLTSASRAMRRALFGNGTYGLDAQGSEESVSALQTSDIQAMYSALVRPNNGVLAIYGDIDAETVRTAVERQTSGWVRQAAPEDNTGGPIALAGREHVAEYRDKKQAVLVIGFPGVDVHNPDRYGLELIQEALSDLGSRLFVRIRENLGLAYYVGAQNFLGLRPGYFAFYAGTAPEKASLVEFELLKEAESLRVGGLTATELQRAKAKLIGQKKIARQDLGAYAMTTALDELYGLGYQSCDSEDARYEAVSLEEIQRIARAYLNPEACIVAVVRPEEESAKPETGR